MQLIWYFCFHMAKYQYPVSTLFGRTLKFLSDEFEFRLKENKIPVSIVEFVLLYRLSMIAEDEITQQNFATLEGKHKSVILRQIDALEEKHLVARMNDPSDGRKNMIVLTKSGMAMLEKAMTVENKMMKELTRGLKPAEIDTLKKVSLTIQQNARKIPAR
jgi:DNA-binding MarR family transcriptional regulator